MKELTGLLKFLKVGKKNRYFCKNTDAKIF